MASSPMWQCLSLALAVSLAGLVLTGSAAGATSPLAVGSLKADPTRSRADALAPGLAPGISGSASLAGEISAQGAFFLSAPVSTIRTGNPVSDVLIRRFLSGTISVSGIAPPIAAGARRRVSHSRTTAHLQVGPRSTVVPMSLRTNASSAGLMLRSYFSLPLAKYGIVSPTGGPPGNMRIAIVAFFPIGKTNR